MQQDTESMRRHAIIRREYPFGYQRREPADWQGRHVTDYERMLNSREWESRSYRIKERDNFCCQKCERTTNLEVHHLKYTTKYPWDEPGENLITLCDICHHAESRQKIDGPISRQALELISGLIKKPEVVSDPNRDAHLQAQIEWARNFHYGKDRRA